VLTLKRAVLCSGYVAEFSPGRPPRSAGVAKNEDHWADVVPAARVVWAISESTVIGSSLPSVDGLVSADGSGVGDFGVGGR
jgi:hypothetical protein